MLSKTLFFMLSDFRSTNNYTRFLKKKSRYKSFYISKSYEYKYGDYLNKQSEENSKLLEDYYNSKC